MCPNTEENIFRNKKQTVKGKTEIIWPGLFIKREKKAMIMAVEVMRRKRKKKVIGNDRAGVYRRKSHLRRGEQSPYSARWSSKAVNRYREEFRMDCKISIKLLIPAGTRLPISVGYVILQVASNMQIFLFFFCPQEIPTNGLYLFVSYIKIAFHTYG